MFSISWSRHYNKQLHLAFSRPKHYSRVNVDVHKSLLKHFPARVTFGENMYGLINQSFNGQALSARISGCILKPSIISTGLCIHPDFPLFVMHTSCTNSGNWKKLKIVPNYCFSVNRILLFPSKVVWFTFNIRS